MKTNPEHFLYARLSTAHGSYNGRITAGENQSKATVPNNDFSIISSDDGLETVCKIVGADPTWLSGQPWAKPPVPASGVLDLYTHDDHGRLLTLIRTDPNWADMRDF